MSLRLDHSGLVARDLGRAAATLRRLGFALTARSDHSVPDAGGGVRHAGTANHCAMLRRGYLEIVAVTEPAAVSFSRTEIGSFAERFEGLHLLAIGADRAAAVAGRLASADGTRAELRDLRRRIETPAGPREARFRLVVAPHLSGPDITFFFIEHETPELLWTEGSTVHPNGAIGLMELVVLVDDVDAAARQYEPAFGIQPAPHAGGLAFELDRSRFILLSRDAAVGHFGAPAPEHARPHCAGQAIAVANLSATADVLTANGVPFRREGGRLTVAPAEACGAFLQFAEDGP